MAAAAVFARTTEDVRRCLASDKVKDRKVRGVGGVEWRRLGCSSPTDHASANRLGAAALTAATPHGQEGAKKLQELLTLDGGAYVRLLDTNTLNVGPGGAIPGAARGARRALRALRQRASPPPPEPSAHAHRAPTPPIPNTTATSWPSLARALADYVAREVAHARERKRSEPAAAARLLRTFVSLAEDGRRSGARCLLARASGALLRHCRDVLAALGGA